MALRPPLDVETFQDLRKLSRWCREQTVGDEGTVTLAQLADITADRIVGRLSTDGTPQELTAAQVSALIQTAFEALDLTFSGDIGFHGEAASAQQTTPSTLSMTTISGSGDDGNINSNFADIEAAVNALKTALDTKGLTG